MPDYKLIALDLDGTLLNSQKELTPASRAALTRAAEAGIEIVPTTGRFYGGMPESVRELPFIRYVISINGAEVKDLQTGEIIYTGPLDELFLARFGRLPYRTLEFVYETHDVEQMLPCGTVNFTVTEDFTRITMRATFRPRTRSPRAWKQSISRTMISCDTSTRRRVM